MIVAVLGVAKDAADPSEPDHGEDDPDAEQDGWDR
jgi:hypothetical protein